MPYNCPVLAPHARPVIAHAQVDCQAGVGLVGSALGGGPALSRTFHAALEGSVAEHFPGNHAINCMCHSTENLYRWVRSYCCTAAIVLLL